MIIIKPSLMNRIYNKIQLNIYVQFGFCIKKSTAKLIFFCFLLLNIYILIEIIFFILDYFSISSF
uniref:Uncharacterized protein n=1 Tax=Vannella simplex TaxID=197532 RepID=A0A2I6SRY4_9EUKA|nr:hypothetical protein [Vannella simplex]